MFTKRLISLYIIVSLLMALGFSFQFHFLIFASMLPLLLSLFSLTVFLEKIRFSSDVKVERVLSDRFIVKGGVLTVKLKVINCKGALSKGFQLDDRFPGESLTLIKGELPVELKADDSGRTEVEYVLEGGREGSFAIGPIYFSFKDKFGFFSFSREIKEFSFVTVLPGVSELKKTFFGESEKHYLWIGPYKSKSKGLSTDYYSSREFQPGDDLRFIDWKATARLGKPVVKEFEARTGRKLVIIADTGESMAGEKLSYLKKAVLLLSSQAIRKGDLVGVLIPTVSGILLPRETSIYVKPGSTVPHFYSILKVSSLLQCFGKPDFSRAIEFLCKRVGAPAKILLVSDLEDFDDKRVYEALEEAVSIGYSVVVVSPSTYLFKRPEQIFPGRDEFSVVSTLHMVEEERERRQRNILKLKGLGVEVYDVGPGDFLPMMIKAYHIMRVK